VSEVISIILFVILVLWCLPPRNNSEFNISQKSLPPPAPPERGCLEIIFKIIVWLAVAFLLLVLLIIGTCGSH
jgi:ABC-type Fe3+ transport system permease subunit